MAELGFMVPFEGRPSVLSSAEREAAAQVLKDTVSDLHEKWARDVVVRPNPFDSTGTIHELTLLDVFQGRELFFLAASRQDKGGNVVSVSLDVRYRNGVGGPVSSDQIHFYSVAEEGGVVRDGGRDLAIEDGEGYEGQSVGPDEAEALRAAAFFAEPTDSSSFFSGFY